MAVLAVIPARFAATRFPGKPLALLAGKPLIQHVWERCKSAHAVDDVIVATEDERILKACQTFGAQVELTSAAHASGTDRVAEVAMRHPEFAAVLNVQGDEPGIDPVTINAVAAVLEHPEIQISTAVSVLADVADLSNPNVVKVVLAGNGNALYFSRAAIPFHRDDSCSPPTYYRHQGIYGFRRDVLLEAAKLPQTAIERAESLEQLRWLHAGYRIRCVTVASHSIGVDTPADLQSIERMFHV